MGIIDSYCVLLPSLSQCGPNNVAADIINSFAIFYPNTKISVFYFKENNNRKKILLDDKVAINKIKFSDSLDLSSFDIIHSHMFLPDLYVAKSKLLGRTGKAKLITTVHQKDFFNLKHDYQSAIKALIISFSWRATFFFFDRIVCLSKSMIKFYGLSIPSKKTTYIYNGRKIDCTQSNVCKKNLDDSFDVIGVVCELTSRKGIDQVVRAIETLSNVKFYIAGEGPEKSNIFDLAVELGVADRVNFCGHINELQSFFCSIDLFVLPSRAEGFPLSLLEAAAYKKACVASRIDIITEVFDENEISLFDLDDISSLKNAIEVGLERRDIISKCIHERYLKDFTADVMASNYWNLFTKL